MKPKTEKQKKAQTRNLSLGRIQRCRLTVNNMRQHTSDKNIINALEVTDTYLEYVYELISESEVDEWDESRQT